MEKKIIIATVKSWNIQNAQKFKDSFKDKHDVVILTSNKELKKENVDKLNPDWIFFPHWSWLIPSEIYKNYTCVVFHITDLPFGRGGTPLQNLILRKIYKTKISAVKVTEEIDAGPIYVKEDFDISLGSAEEIFIRASNIIFFRMIPLIITKNPQPKEQQGEIKTFKRRRPQESDLRFADIHCLDDFYDFIRMLDGEGYPKASMKFGKFKIKFCEAHRKVGKIVGRFEISEEM